MTRSHSKNWTADFLGVQMNPIFGGLVFRSPLYMGKTKRQALDNNTGGIRKPDRSGFWMVERRLVHKWSGFRMAWTKLQNVQFLKESVMWISGFRIPTVKFIIYRSEINWRSESSYFGWAVHRRDAGSNQERIRDWAYASRRLKPGTVRRVSVGRSRDRVDGRRAWAWVRLQLGWNLQVEMWQARNTYTSLNAFCYFQT